MNNNIIADGILYIGADDKDLDLFEGQYSIPEGISYNSYLIVDQEVAVFDTIDARRTNEWKENLVQALNGRTPDYLVVSHMEPDHSANLKRMLDAYPTCTVVCSQRAVPMMERFFGVALPAERLMVVKDGDTLPLGEHSLRFFTAPMVHWPEVIMSYEEKEGILFSADAFGKFGALSYDDPEGWACEARRYYFNIVGKYGVQVQAVLKKLAGLDIRKICPLHGPVLDENLDYYLQTYDTWSSYRPEDKGVFIDEKTCLVKISRVVKPCIPCRDRIPRVLRRSCGLGGIGRPYRHRGHHIIGRRACGHGIRCHTSGGRRMRGDRRRQAGLDIAAVFF